MMLSPQTHFGHTWVTWSEYNESLKRSTVCQVIKQCLVVCPESQVLHLNLNLHHTLCAIWIKPQPFKSACFSNFSCNLKSSQKGRRMHEFEKKHLSSWVFKGNERQEGFSQRALNTRTKKLFYNSHKNMSFKGMDFFLVHYTIYKWLHSTLCIL